VLSVTTPSLPPVSPLVVFLRLCSWSFIMCITPLSTLMSSLSLNHHFYSDDTQLLISYPSNLDSSITHLQNALQAILSWMSANLLTLNTSKTEFLLIGLQQQVAKIIPHLIQYTLLVTVASFLMNILPFLTRYLLFLILLLTYSSTSLHLSICWSQNSQHHCYLHRSL